MSGHASAAISIGAQTHKKWYEYSLIPPAYHVRDGSSERIPSNPTTRAIRLQALTGEHCYRFPDEAAAAAAAHLDPELIHNRAALGAALAAAAAATLVQHPAPEAAVAAPSATGPQQHSVLAYAAANLPVGSSIDPHRLGHQLVFPAPRPTSRKQVSYLFFALEHMLTHVGKQAAAVNAAGASDSSVSIPSLMESLPSYASWCGLQSSAMTSAPPGQLTSPVADLAIGAFSHVPATQAQAQTQSPLTPTSKPTTSSHPAPSTVDLRFQTSVEALQRFAAHDNDLPRPAAGAHHCLTTVLQEQAVYLVGLYEIARQDYTHCQERGDLLHLLTQRLAVLLQTTLVVAQREVVGTVARFKGEIHGLMQAQERAFDTERANWAQQNTRNSAKIIQMKEELQARAKRIKELEDELTRRRLECSDTDRILAHNSELRAQLASLREQVSSADSWRAEQQVTLERLHFDLKDSRARMDAMQAERDRAIARGEKQQQELQAQLVAMQTRFLELRIPDAVDPGVKSQIENLMRQREREQEGKQSHLTAAAGGDSVAQKDAASTAVAPIDTSATAASTVSFADSPLPSPSTPDGHDVGDATPLDGQSDLATSPSRPRRVRRGSRSVGPGHGRHKSAPSPSWASGASLASKLAAATIALIAQRSRNSNAQQGPKELTAAEADTYILCHTARCYESIVSKAQRRKFQQIHTVAAAATGGVGSGAGCVLSSKQLSVLHLPGSVGPRDWAVNFAWSALKSKIDADELADCYLNPRRAFADFFHQLILLHESVRGGRSAYLAVMWTVLRSLIVWRHTSPVASLVLDLLEGVHSPHTGVETTNFVLAALVGLARTPVGVSYGEANYGGTRWVCTLRTRFVNQLLLGSPGQEDALKALNDEVDRRSVTITREEIKQQQAALGLRGEGQEDSEGAGGPSNPSDPLHAQQLKKLTKIDLGIYLTLCAKHHALQHAAQLRNLRAHFRTAAQAQATAQGATTHTPSLGFKPFAAFMRQVQPTMDSRHMQMMYAEAMQYSTHEGITFDNFIAAGGSQVLSQDYSRLVHQHSEWSVLHGEQELVSCVRGVWQRLQPTLRPFLQLAHTDGSALSALLSERLTRLETHLHDSLLSLHHNLNGARVRQAVATLRDIIYEVYGYMRYRETYGALVRVRGMPEQSAPPLRLLSVPPPGDLSSACGPAVPHLTDELHALLYMVQKEMEAFTADEQVPAYELIRPQQEAPVYAHAQRDRRRK